MTPEDLQQLARVAVPLRDLGRIGVLSPARGAERRIFPGAAALPRWRWDLDRPGRRAFDLLVAANVFLCSDDPARWFRHVLACCRYLLLLDVVRRRRSPDSELGPDGDRTRFSIGGARPRVERSFDLDSLGERLLAHRTYAGGANEFDDAPLHFLALIRGDLADPVLRIDDYPTGVRPILDDLTPLHALLDKVEARGLRYHLGIVPALLDRRMGAFLETLERMVPAAHGYDHGYPERSARLLDSGDPLNARTLGAFNEFSGRSYTRILAALTAGREAIERSIGRPVEAYIPPGNRGDRRTGRALARAGFRYYLSDRRVPGCALPWFRSDFSGRSTEFDPAAAPRVVALHLTWEWDVARARGPRPLERLLDSLAARAAAAKREAARLAAAVGA